MIEVQPLAGRAGWYGKDLDQSGAWIRTLTDAHRAELDQRRHRAILRV